MWPWQNDVLTAYAGTSGDAAVELPTGTGKTLVDLLAGEHFREGGPVAYLAGDKQLAQQVERHGRDLRLPIVRFQGAKDSWSAHDVRAFNFAEAIGAMKYWNYFNASPGVEPAGMLILDDVHLLEGPLRDLFEDVPLPDGQRAPGSRPWGWAKPPRPWWVGSSDGGGSPSDFSPGSPREIPTPPSLRPTCQAMRAAVLWAEPLSQPDDGAE